MEKDYVSRTTRLSILQPVKSPCSQFCVARALPHSNFVFECSRPDSPVHQTAVAHAARSNSHPSVSAEFNALLDPTPTSIYPSYLNRQTRGPTSSFESGAMAVPRAHHFSSQHQHQYQHQHQHQHHHHHTLPPHRKKRGNHSNQPGPLRQLQDQEDDLAGTMGGGSSRDASEVSPCLHCENHSPAHFLIPPSTVCVTSHASLQEDNDAFSEHSDSASIQNVRMIASPSSSSVREPIHALPTTARDRALVDSRPAAAGSSAQPRQSLGATCAALNGFLSSNASPLRKLTVASTQSIAGQSSSYSLPFAHAPHTSFGRSSGDQGSGRDSTVAATLAQASAAMSSSSSADLSRYGGDDEDATSGFTNSGSVRSGSHRFDSIDSSSTDGVRGGSSVQVGALGAELAALAPTSREAPPSRDLNLSSLPKRQQSTSSIHTNSTSMGLAIPTPHGGDITADFVTGGYDADNVSSSSCNSGRVRGRESSDAGNRSVKLDSDYLNVSSEAKSGLAPGAAALAPLSGGKPSASHLSVLAGLTNARSAGHKASSADADADLSDGGTASPYDGDVEFAARIPVFQSVAQQHSAAVALGEPVVPLLTSQSQRLAIRNDARDVPCRAYATAQAEAASASEGSRPHLLPSPPTRRQDFASAVIAPNPGSQFAKPSAGQPELSLDEIYSGLSSLNQPQVLAQLRSKASTSRVKLYVEADFDILQLSRCASLLRTAKLCLAGAGTGSNPVTRSTEPSSAIDVVAGIPTSAEDSEDAASAGVIPSAAGQLPIAERASLARSCRWVDEVVEGVPRLAFKYTGDDYDDDRRHHDRMHSVLADVGAQYCARFVCIGTDPCTLGLQAPWEIRLPCSI